MLKAIALALTILLVACGAQDPKPRIKMGDRASAEARTKEERAKGSVTALPSQQEHAAGDQDGGGPAPFIHALFEEPLPGDGIAYEGQRN